jgi:hypothetical protein
MEFNCTGTSEGIMQFSSDYSRASFKEFLRTNGPVRLTITPELPESAKMRRWYEGAVVPLITFYQDGLDHRSGEDRRKVREWLKGEFNGEMVEIGGKIHTVAKTTKGRETFNPFVERVVGWLEDNYAPPAEALDPEKYKHWKAAIYPHGGPETYIDYLVELNILTV